MSLLQIVVVALIQGLTEFLPIPVRPQLDLLQAWVGWELPDLGLGLAIHIGLLFASLLYFARDVGAMIGAVGRAPKLMARHRPLEKEFWLLIKLVAATIPAAAGAWAIMRYQPTWLSLPELAAWNTIIFAILLYLIDGMFMTVRRMEHISILEGLLLGCFQALALIPGVGRSAITMTGGRLFGVERPEAVRFSLLMAIPLLIATVAREGYTLSMSNVAILTSLRESAIGGGVAFVAGLISIAFLMAWLKNSGFGLFVIYRLAVGIALLATIYGLPSF